MFGGGYSASTFGQPASTFGQNPNSIGSSGPTLGDSSIGATTSSRSSSVFGPLYNFGQNPNSIGSNSSNSAAPGTPFGASSTGATSAAFSQFGNANHLGSGSITEQRSNANNHNPFAQEGSLGSGTCSAFSTSTWGSSLSAGNSASVLGGKSGFGTNAAPSFSVFGTTSSSSFGASSGSGAFAPGASIPFGSTHSPSNSTLSPFAFGQPITTSHNRSVLGTIAWPATSIPGSIKSGPSTISSEHCGSGVASYFATRAEGSWEAPGLNLVSISAMPIYQSKSHEELRFEDYQLSVNKASAFGQPPSTFGQNPNSIGSIAPTFGDSSIGETTSARSSSAFGQLYNFGQNPNSIGSNSSNSAAPGTPFGVSSTGATSAAISQFGNSNHFWSGSISGQRSNTNNGNPFAQEGSLGTCSALGTSTWGSSMSAGNSASLFGGNSGFGTTAFPNASPSSSVFGTTSSFGASSGIGAFPPGASTNSTLSPFAFGRPIFGQQITTSHNRSAFGTIAGTATSIPGSFKSRPSTISSDYRGSGVASYFATRDEASGGAPGQNLVSISAMPTYQSKSHEELRFEDYQLSVNKASTLPTPVGHAFDTLYNKPQTSSAVSTGPGAWGSFPSSTPSTFTFQSQPQTISTGTGSWLNFPPSVASTSTFQSQPQVSSTMSNETGETPGNPYSNALSSHTFQSRPQESNATPTSTGPWDNLSSPSSFTFQISPQFQPVFTSLDQWQTSSSMPTAGPGPCGEVPLSTIPLTQISAPTALTWTKPEHVAAPHNAETTPTHAFTLEQPSAGTMKSETHNQSIHMQQSDQSRIVVTPSAVASPFGLQSRCQTSANSLISDTTVRHGISSMPISDNPSPIKRASMLSSWNLTLGRGRISLHKPKSDGQKVPFYEEIVPGVSKAATFINPRQNPRSWVLNPMERGVVETKSSNASLLGVNAGNSDDSLTGKNSSDSSAKWKLNMKVALDAYSAEDDKLHYAADVEGMMPKLQSLDYYIYPPIQELAARERVEPGFCCHVKDFVVGRMGYGSIKFLGETDVRNLDLESLIKFNHREVIVYMDESKKPQVGQGLNKPADITVLNVKCIDKGTGKQYVDGPKVEKFRKMLIEMAAKQGVEFVSYDPVLGEWKFMVQHF